MIILDTIQINWEKNVTKFANIANSKKPKFDKKGFYAILSGVLEKDEKGNNQYGKIKLLYIGQAFDQILRKRIPQKHDAYACVNNYKKKHPNVEILVMLGTIEKSTVGKLTQQLFNDIECCLIFSNNPLCNETCQDCYSGRDLKIVNTGHPYPLEKESTCAEKKK